MPTQAEILDEIKGRVKSGAITREKAIELVERAQQYGQETVSEKFDPEGSGYDYETAKAYGISPDETGHWQSREPSTGQILKGRKHETYPKTVAGENEAGHEIYQGSNGRYYSRTKPFPTGADSPISRAIKNFVPNAPKALYNLVPGIVDTTDPLTGEQHPGAMTMLGDIGKLGIGLANKVLPGGMQIPGQGESERAVNDLAAHIAPSDIGAAWEDFAEHPAERVTEAAMLASGGKALLKGGARGVKAGARGAAQLVPEAAKATLESGSRKLMGNAMGRPLRKSFRETTAKTAITEALKRGEPLTKEARAKWMSEVDGLNQRIANYFKDTGEKGAGIPLDDVLGRLNALKEQAQLAGDPNAMAQIVKIEDFYRNPTDALKAKYKTNAQGQTLVPDAIAHDMKRAIYKDIGSRPYGVVDSEPWTTAARKQVARGFKEEVAARHPDLAELNAADSRLLALEETAGPKLRREGNNQLIGLGEKAATIAGYGLGGKLGAAAGAVIGALDRSASFKSRMAIAMNRLAKAGVKADEAAVAELIRQNPGGFPEGTFPEIDSRDRVTRGLLPETTTETVTPQVVEGGKRLLRSAPYTVDSRGRAIPPEYVQRRAAELKNAPVEDAQIIRDTPRAALNPGIWGKSDTGVFPGPGMELPPEGVEPVAPVPKTRRLLRSKNPILTEAEADAAKRAAEGVPVEGAAGSAARAGKRLVRSRDEAGTPGQGAGGVGTGLPAKKGDAGNSGPIPESAIKRLTVQGKKHDALPMSRPNLTREQVKKALDEGYDVPADVLEKYGLTKPRRLKARK